MQKFDLIVIGSGSGLDVANAIAAGSSREQQQAFKVAIIEKDRLGGTCLNRGCIPSKLLIHSANVIKTINNAKTFGITINGRVSINFQKIMSRVNDIIDSESREIKRGLDQIGNPKLFQKECKFIDKKTIEFIEKDKNKNRNSEIITAEKFLIATGTSPNIPEIKGLEKTDFLTSNEALKLKEQPKTLSFIGGGYIACEMAHFFGSLGTKINIIQRSNLLVPNEDREISEKITKSFSEKYNIYTGFNPESVSQINYNNNKNKTFHIVAKNVIGDTIEVDSDELIISAGRTPNTPQLDLEKTGVKVDEKGFIIVDQYLETSTPGIFAIGDVVGKCQFKHNANHETRYAYNNILYDNEKQPVEYVAMPHAIFSSPQIASVGFTEQQLKNKGTKYLKSVYPYIQTGMGQAIEDKEGFVKFLVNENNRKILGCHILGTDASTLIHEVLVSMRMGDGTIESISETIHIHPSLSEVIHRAAIEI